mgnify:FL=1
MTETSLKPIISTTGQLRGKGSDRYKRVISLTRGERDAVIAGEIVLVKCPWGDHPGATPYKQVGVFTNKWGKKTFFHVNYYPSDPR